MTSSDRDPQAPKPPNEAGIPSAAVPAGDTPPAAGQAGNEVPGTAEPYQDPKRPARDSEPSHESSDTLIVPPSSATPTTGRSRGTTSPEQAGTPAGTPSTKGPSANPGPAAVTESPPVAARHAALTPEPGSDASPEEIEDDIERTRHDLGETVEELSKRLDVKAQAREQLDTAKEQVAAQVDHAKRTASDYAQKTKDTFTDETGKPNNNAWIGLAVSAVALAALTVVLIKRARE
ncbi:DUF3618 domain-containing protein [Brevibacterium sp.]|uniref:DUF3618 domain-containing protein n=1 Tax=Brevibacterium sp. TaxID=1701 RepID=UPI002811B60D|nr:DUF3618 domain-containing protein [Brevibacterium sp.]